MSVITAIQNIEKNMHAFALEQTFTGEPSNPMLAPRGVFLHEKILVVSDTGQNRVFIWKNFDERIEQKATVVLGQTGNSNTERNAGDSVNASSLQYPSGVWTNGKKLIVADAWNHRVLIWHSMPTTNGQPADVVLGQMDFESNQPNVMGLGKMPTAHTLYWPYGVFSDGNHLWVADTGNRRVLFYNKIPEANFAGADGLVGQEHYCDKDYDNNNAVWPYSVKINTNGSMAIADTQYYRVMLWKNYRDAFNKPADTIIGQADINSSGQNQFKLKPAANTLNWCYDCCFWKNGIAVADTGNSRILVWNDLPEINNVPANSLIGQQHFEMNGESSLSMKTTLQNEMYWPFTVNTCDDKLIVADTGNHRILIYKPIAK